MKCQICNAREKTEGLYCCMRCYVTRNAKQLKIGHYKWFKFWRHKFDELLQARYFAIIYGLDYPKERSRFYLVWDNKNTRKEEELHAPCMRNINTLRKIDKLIINMERQAKRYLEYLNRQSEDQ